MEGKIRTQWNDINSESKSFLHFGVMLRFRILRVSVIHSDYRLTTNTYPTNFNILVLFSEATYRDNNV